MNTPAKHYETTSIKTCVGKRPVTREGHDMEVGMVEFEKSPKDSFGCAEALTELMTALVSQQPNFRTFMERPYVEESSGSVINVTRWTKAVDFIEFRYSAWRLFLGQNVAAVRNTWPT